VNIQVTGVQGGLENARKVERFIQRNSNRKLPKLGEGYKYPCIGRSEIKFNTTKSTPRYNQDLKGKR
jgi:hypothetical protein